MAESQPLMDESDNAGIRNTTLQFLRSFSIISDDSDFDELEEPETPGDFLDHGSRDDDLDSSRRSSTVARTPSDPGKTLDQTLGEYKLINWGLVYECIFYYIIFFQLYL